MSDNEQSSGSPSELELLKQRARLLGVGFSNNIGLETLRERVAAKMAAIGEGDEPAAEKPESQPNPLDQGNEDEGQANPLGDFDDDIEEEAAEEQAQPALASGAPINLKPVAPLDPVDLPDPTKSVSIGSPVAEPASGELNLRQRLFNENMKLIRVRIQNLDPKKKDLAGEIISVSNKVLGTVKRFVPYGDVTDDGWHIPYIIYKELSTRKFLQITTTKDRQTKQVKVVKRWAKEFAFEVLPPLTEQELRQLAAAQAAAGSIESNSDQIL